MKKQRIELTDSTPDVLFKMSDGNPGALNALMEILTKGKMVDPDDEMEGFGSILLLDSYGIYGTDIYILHNDICRRDLTLTIACLRACQMGLFPSETLVQACMRQRSGASLVIPDALLLAVKEKLPNFGSQTITD